MSCLETRSREAPGGTFLQRWVVGRRRSDKAMHLVVHFSGRVLDRSQKPEAKVGGRTIVVVEVWYLLHVTELLINYFHNKCGCGWSSCLMEDPCRNAESAPQYTLRPCPRHYGSSLGHRRVVASSTPLNRECVYVYATRMPRR